MIKEMLQGRKSTFEEAQVVKNIVDMHNDVIVEILKYLNVSDLYQLKQTNHYWLNCVGYYVCYFMHELDVSALKNSPEDVSKLVKNFVSEKAYLEKSGEKRIAFFTTLDLSNVPVERDALLYAAEENRHWQAIRLFDCTSIRDDVLIAFARNCKGLRHVNIGLNSAFDDTRWLTSASIEELARNCPHLQYLDISNRQNVSGAALSMVFQNCEGFHTLVMNNCSISYIPLEGCKKGLSLKRFIARNATITDKLIVSLAENCEQLHTVDITDCCKIGNRSMEVLVSKHAKSLRELKIHGCNRVTAKLILFICEVCNNLEVFESNSHVTDEVVFVLSKNACQLTSVKLEGSDITDRSIEHLKSLETLQHVQLYNCFRVSSDVEELRWNGNKTEVTEEEDSC